ncbi:MAG TPA: SufD family Fe-S cluster assembly protein [Mesotoga sp.]|nr:SufD family Fe-S cluster assembly protein [Mesotoga sp.]
MEKTLNLEHNNYKMVSPLRRELEIPDYGDRDFLISSEPLGNAMSVFVSNRYSEYRKLAFPLWKRVDISKMVLPPVSGKNGKHYPDPYVKPIKWLTSEEVELLDNLDFEGSDRKLLLLGDIFFDTGYFVSVPSGIHLKEPYIFNREEMNSSISSNLFVAGKGSKMKIVLNSTGRGKWSLQNNRFLLKRESSIDLLVVNGLSKSDFSFLNNFYLLEAGARLNVYEVSYGGGVLASYHMGVAAGEESRTVFEPVFMAYGDSKIDLQYIARVKSARSQAIIDGTGVVMDRGHSIFRGTVDLKKGSRGATGKEHSSVMVLSREARTDAIPSLLVDENEVNASHAATVGSLDEEKIFYLMSRGLTREEALKFIIKGTFDPVLGKVVELFPDHSRGLDRVFA